MDAISEHTGYNPVRRQKAAFQLSIGEQAAQPGASFDLIEEQSGVPYYELKQLREQYLNGTLQR